MSDIKVEFGNVRKITPKRKGQNLAYKDIQGLPKWEIVGGKLLWANNEMESALLAILANFGLEACLSALPIESLTELEQILSEKKEELGNGKTNS
jgi:hypothetical protein